MQEVGGSQLSTIDGGIDFMNYSKNGNGPIPGALESTVKPAQMFVR